MTNNDHLMRIKFFFPITLTLLASASLTLAQNINQAAVDTLTKDVAIAVFAPINQPKAQEIYAQLLNCGDGCDPQQVIRGVGSWDQVGEKMQELSELKNTQRFQNMAPAEANTAIRKQLTKFYTAHKAEKPYSVPLSSAVQAQIIAKIDALLPPAPVVESTSSVSGSPEASQAPTDEETGISSTALQISRLESQVKNEQEKQFWMILVSAFLGLLGGAAAVYFLLYRETKAEVNRLRDENSRLSRSLDAAQRPKPVNELRQPQNVNRQQAKADETVLPKSGTNVDPVAATQPLKQQTPDTMPEPAPIVRSGEPIVEPAATPELIPVQNQTQPAPVEQAPTSTQAPARPEVFYFPPPDPNGQFDITHKSSTLSPESAYRFSVNAETSDRETSDRDGPTVASFRFEAEPGRVARFLTYRNYMIEPACDSENSYTATHTRIAMRRDGEAAFENGVWRVKTKALIRYE